MRLLPFLMLVVACGGARPDPVSVTPKVDAAPVKASKPAPIVVSIVVDQLAAWMAAERWPALPATGGFARLRREGVTETDVRYMHAVTDTAPGHAALFTGLTPRESGVYANDVLDEKGAARGVLRDEQTKLVSSDGPTDAAGSSLARLTAPTLADTFRAAHADADIVALSLKDRGAIFGGGRAPSAVLWFDTKLDAFVTSTAFAQTLPAWAKEHASHASLEGLRAPPWAVTDGAWVASHALTPDAQPGEADESGYGTTFPHLVSASQRPASAFRASPYADAAVLRLAADAIAAHDPQRPMLLALSLSANDTVAHTFGPDSWESWDDLMRLDAELAKLFAALDAKVGADGWSAALTADHGSSTLPEAADVARPWCKPGSKPDPWERPCGTLGRIVGDAFGEALEAAARKSLGKSAPKGKLVQGVADPYVYLPRDVLALPKVEREKVIAAVRDAAKATPGVDRVASFADAPCPAADAPNAESVDALVCRSMSAKNPDALYVVTAPGWFFDAGYVLRKGSSHGAPYAYNRAVPLVVRAPRRAQPGLVEVAPRRATTFTATMAALLEIRAFPVSQTESLVK